MRVVGCATPVRGCVTCSANLPKQPAYNKRLRQLGTQMTHMIALLGADTDQWRDPIRLADSTPVPCGTSRETVKRSQLSGWAGYGYCASHSRRFWGLRLHLVTTVHGLPLCLRVDQPHHRRAGGAGRPGHLAAQHVDHADGMILVVDKGYRDQATETWLGERDITMVRPAYRNEKQRPGRALLRAVRQSIDSVNDTFKGQLGLEQHGGRTITGVAVRVPQRILALTAAIWHNWHTGQPVMRSLVAYDHP
jgi:hypothetical protein